MHRDADCVFQHRPCAGLKAASVRVRDPALAAARLAFDRVDSTARLCRLLSHREAGAVAGWARVLFDLGRHRARHVTYQAHAGGVG